MSAPGDWTTAGMDICEAGQAGLAPMIPCTPTLHVSVPFHEHLNRARERLTLSKDLSEHGMQQDLSCSTTRMKSKQTTMES